MEDTHVVIDDLDKALKKIQQESSTTANTTKNESKSENSNSGESHISSGPTENNLSDNNTPNHSSSTPKPATSFYAVYDGHGGVHAATMCEDIFHKNLISTEEFRNNNF